MSNPASLTIEHLHLKHLNNSINTATKIINQQVERIAELETLINDLFVLNNNDEPYFPFEYGVVPKSKRKLIVDILNGKG